MKRVITTAIFTIAPYTPSSAIASASLPGVRYLIIWRSINSLAVPAMPLMRRGSEYTNIFRSSALSMRGTTLSVEGSMARSVTRLATRLATSTQPTPNSEEYSPVTPKAMASDRFSSMLSALSMTKRMARPCSRSRAKGIIAQMSSMTIAATIVTYSGCATYTSPMARDIGILSTQSSMKKSVAASDVMPHVVANTLRLAVLTSPPSSSARVVKRK